MYVIILLDFIRRVFLSHDVSEVGLLPVFGLQMGGQTRNLLGILVELVSALEKFKTGKVIDTGLTENRHTPVDNRPMIGPKYKQILF
jgi:hypothetical protein